MKIVHCWVRLKSPGKISREIPPNQRPSLTEAKLNYSSLDRLVPLTKQDSQTRVPSFKVKSTRRVGSISTPHFPHRSMDSVIKTRWHSYLSRCFRERRRGFGRFLAATAHSEASRLLFQRKS